MIKRNILLTMIILATALLHAGGGVIFNKVKTDKKRTYLATDYINSDGNRPGRENTVAQWQTMIDACAATGGTIFFPDGHYVCKADSRNTLPYILLKTGVNLKGTSAEGCTIEFQSATEGCRFFRIASGESSISDFTIIHNLLNEYIPPLNKNMGKRLTFSIDKPNTKFVLNNCNIKNINLKNGYSADADNFVAASAAYMILRIVNNDCRVMVNNCNAESNAWGVFNASSNSDLIWNGNLKCWYKCTGLHGSNSRIIVNGNLTSYGSGSFACCSCSGGHTIVNGNIFRVPEVDAPYSLYGSAVYAGADDEATIIVNGNVYTCSGVYQGIRGVCEINGNVYCLDNSYTKEIPRILFQCDSYNDYFSDVKFTGNIVCSGIKPFALFNVNGGKLSINGNSFSSYASRIVSKADGTVTICGCHTVIKDRFIRINAGTLNISGQYYFSSNHEMFQLMQGDHKTVNVMNASFIKGVKDYDRLGNDVTTTSATGNALFFNHSAEQKTVIRCCNVFTNADFSQNYPFPVELHNVSASSLGVAIKKNFFHDL